MRRGEQTRNEAAGKKDKGRGCEPKRFKKRFFKKAAGRSGKGGNTEMTIDIISYTDEQFAAMTEEQILEVESVQLKKIGSRKNWGRKSGRKNSDC